LWALQVEALSKQKIESYLLAQEEEARNPRPSADPARNAEAGKPIPVSSSKQAKVSSQVSFLLSSRSVSTKEFNES
jgi:hypothetical protein